MRLGKKNKLVVRCCSFLRTFCLAGMCIAGHALAQDFIKPEPQPRTRAEARANVEQLDRVIAEASAALTRNPKSARCSQLEESAKILGGFNVHCRM
jgi:hypothetical protein